MAGVGLQRVGAEAYKNFGGLSSELVQYLPHSINQRSHRVQPRFKVWRKKNLLIGEAAKSHSNGHGYRGDGWRIAGWILWKMESEVEISMQEVI